MKRSTSAASSADETETGMGRFSRILRGLMAVPKSELDAKIAEKKRFKSRRATAKG